MYEPHDVLNRIDQHPVQILIFCGLAVAFNFAWYAEAIRLARRDRCVTMPPGITLIYFAHDGSYVLRFDTWWQQYPHWFTQLFWVGLVIMVLGEVVLFGQTLRYGRQELAPRLSQRTFATLMCAGLAVIAAAWTVTKGALGDDLYLVSFMVLLFWAYPFASAQMLRRGSGAGTSTWLWASAGMISVTYGLSTVLWFGPPFHTVRWIALWLGSVAWGGYNTWLAHQLTSGDRSLPAARTPSPGPEKTTDPRLRSDLTGA